MNVSSTYHLQYYHVTFSWSLQRLEPKSTTLWCRPVPCSIHLVHYPRKQIFVFVKYGSRSRRTGLNAQMPESDRLFSSTPLCKPWIPMAKPHFSMILIALSLPGKSEKWKELKSKKCKELNSVKHCILAWFFILNCRQSVQKRKPPSRVPRLVWLLQYSADCFILRWSQVFTDFMGQLHLYRWRPAF